MDSHEFLGRTASPRIEYWLKGEETQNFGDYLSELFMQELLDTAKVYFDVYHLIGSVIDSNVSKYYYEQWGLPPDKTTGYWGCGCRIDAPLSKEIRSRSVFFGVRGPLTRRLLDLPANTTLGDPALTLPAFYDPQPCQHTAGQAICVPHFCDTKTHEDLIAISGTNTVVMPAISNNVASLKLKIDEIAAASFVLAGSLHAAIIACAYGVPFAFWDNDHLDVPFKWRDFASSIGVPACFVSNVSQGKIAYGQIISPALRKPKLMPILMAAPFTIRDKALERAGRIDAGA